jgi:PAS domain S-box-containing protein
MAYFSNWFQLEPIGSDIIQGHYNLMLVGLSYLVAVLASYVAINLVNNLRAAQRGDAKIYWLTGGAFAMGAGIWSMHFIGILAFTLPISLEYKLGWAVASLIMAIFASGLVLFLLQKADYSKSQLMVGGVIIGLVIATMHYMGMEGMKTYLNIHYLPGLFFLSVFIGISAAEAALYLALDSNKGSHTRQFNFKIISALMMGVSICGMHYTAMAAAVFTEKASHNILMDNHPIIQAHYLAFFIAGITTLIISLVLTVSNSNKKMVTAIENEKEFLQAMLDNLEDGIIACDASGTITVINKAIQQSINAGKNDLNLDELLDYVTLFDMNNKPLENEKLPLNVALRGELVEGVELIMKFKNNTVRHVVIDGQKIINTDGKNLGAIAVIHDVTELKKTEKLKNEFVSIVSHELRTPLTSIRGSLGLLVSGVLGQFSEKANKLIEIANTNCERLLLLINDILDIEKIEAGKMDFQLKREDLNEIVQASVVANTMYAEKFGVSITVIPLKVPVVVNVDASRLMQVLANLISNACKFSPKDEEITIMLQRINGTVRVSISDKGSGIPAEFQQRIFQKFSQADSSDTRGKGGTGLGLNISKTIIEKLGGTLDFISKENQGTTFYFDLPIALDLPAVIYNPINGVIEAQKRILICEDDQDQSAYLRILLESAGFVVDVADTVTKTKELLIEHNYQALLLDLIMPDQDGIAFIRELRANKKNRDLHIIVISIIAQTGESLLKGEEGSIIDWFDKPIDFNKLLTSINRIKK